MANVDYSMGKCPALMGQFDLQMPNLKDPYELTKWVIVPAGTVATLFIISRLTRRRPANGKKKGK